MFFAGAMACASMHRVTFSVLAIPIQEEFGLSLPQLGVLQSAVLAGYITGQVSALLDPSIGHNFILFSMLR